MVSLAKSLQSSYAPIRRLRLADVGSDNCCQTVVVGRADATAIGGVNVLAEWTASKAYNGYSLSI
jgi:hypothetical protein